MNSQNPEMLGSCTNTVFVTLSALTSPSQRYYSALGQIVDMNKEGLAFQYVAGLDADGYRPGEQLVEIFAIAEPYLQVGTIPCRILYDVPILADLGHPITMRRCGLEFGEIPNKQLVEVEHFIQTYQAT